VGDVTFNSGHITILAGVLGPLLAAIGFLTRQLLAAKDDQIKLGAAALTEALTTNKALSAAVVEATKELRELRADLWREKRVGKPESPP
jgi:hypothetical protein